MQRIVWQVDPIHLTPYYDAALCRALARAGWSVRQFTAPFLYDAAFHPAQDYTVDDVYGRGLKRRGWLNYPRLRRGLRALAYVSGHRRLIQMLEAHPPDVVHIQWSRLPKLDHWLIEQIRQRGIPVVHTVHDVEPLFAHASAGDLAAVYALANRLIVHTSANREALLDRYPRLEADRIRVIPHIAIDFPVPEKADREQARRELRIPPGVPVILFFGTARPYKGLDVLIGAYRRALHDRPDLWLVIAGLQDKASVVGMMGRQMLVERQYVPSDRVWAYHLAADVSVFPYTRVSQSGALITAMGFGLPVIVTDVGGLPETVDGNGWVVPPDSSDWLGSALIEAVRDGERLRRMGVRSCQLVRERCAPEQVAAQTTALYEEMIGSCSESCTVPTA